MSRLVTARIASMSVAIDSPFAPTSRPSDQVVIYEPFARSVSRAGLGSLSRASVGPLDGVGREELQPVANDPSECREELVVLHVDAVEGGVADRLDAGLADRGVHVELVVEVLEHRTLGDVRLAGDDVEAAGREPA